MADALDDVWWNQDEDVPKKGEKRKAEAADPTQAEVSTEVTGKKKRRRKKKNLSQELAEKGPVDGRQEFLTLFRKYSAENILDLEKDEFAIEESHLVDLVSSQDLSPCERLLRDVPKAAEVLRKSPRVNGSPAILIVSASALRVIELAKLFAGASEGFQIAKLFAKHKKVPEQKDLLSTTAIKIAVGTPKRVCDLLDLDLLSLSKLRLVVLDWHFRDIKLRRLADTQQIRQDAMTLLHKHLLFKVLKHFVRVVLL